MKKIFLWCTLLLTSWLGAQTILIDPSAGGGFESGTTLLSNGWSSVVPTADIWVVGAAPAPTSANCGYISNDNGTSWIYSQLSTYSHLYRDVTVPAGELKGKLTFDWKVGGEGSTTSDWDNLKIFLVPVTTTPLSTAAVSTTGGTQLSGAGSVSGMYKLSSTTWNSETINFVFPSSGSWRIVFSWKSDVSTIANPPAAIDNVSLTSNVPGNFTSVATGNWGTAATWDANAVPTAADNVTVDTGHTVTIDAASQAANNLTVKGTLNYGTTPASFAVNNDLNVNSGGLVSVFNGTTGKTLTVKGNIVNDGAMDISVGATSAGNLTLNGSNVQTVSGSGTFTNGNIRNLTFSNTNTSIPNINWSMNVAIAYNLSMTGARVNLGTSKVTFGYNAAGNTLTAPSGTGFLPGGKFSRYWTATATGTAVTAGVDPTNTTSRYPFVNNSGRDRSMYITRTNATGAAAGELAAVYTDANTMTTGLNITDGSYTITDRYDGNWKVSNEGTSVNASSYTVVLLAPGAYQAANGNSRVMAANAALSGTHQNGTTTPGAQRITVSQTDLLSGPLYIGVNTADTSFVSIASGNWNDPTTWNKGVLPSCTDGIVIASPHIVTVISGTNVSKNITIANGGTLAVGSGDLTVGCTLNNNFLTNNGTLTVAGGTLNVNGNIANTATSVFNQSGGDIKIDGNAAGAVASSVASGTPLFSSASTNINLTGGTLTIVDPHTATTNSSAYAVYYNFGSNSTSAVATSPNHTIKFGDGISTDGGGNTSGFYVNTWNGSGFLNFGNIIVNGPSGTNRGVVSQYQLAATGNVDINSGGTLTVANTFLGGNLNVNTGGKFVSTSGLATGIVTASSASTLTTAPATSSQTISNNGTLGNLATAPTANLNNFTVNNTSTGGVTLNSPVSVGGTLTLNAGKVNTTSTNLLTLGTATLAGTLAGGSDASYINGPFARTIASGNANTNFILFPVGKAAYAPVSLAPTTTAVANMKAEAFDSNSGSAGSMVQAGTVSTSRRWEAFLVSGTMTDIQLRIADSGIQSDHVPAQAPSANGAYDLVFGKTATYTAATATMPNSLQTATALAAADYTGYLSYAKLDSTLSVSGDYAANKLVKVYPNPFGEVINITNIKDLNMISVADASGRIVKVIRNAGSLSNINLGELKSGVYVLKLDYNTGSTKSVKVIKK